jgi:isopentenyl diphosphate isomerase/L-lactate dehydrogenase-like FMN-dependent dehydrogenase
MAPCNATGQGGWPVRGAFAGETGVAHAISLLRKELDKDRALLGARTQEELARDMLTEVRGTS